MRRRINHQLSFQSGSCCSQRPAALGGDKVKSGDNKNAHARQGKPPMSSAHGEENPPEACGQQEQGKDAQY